MSESESEGTSSAGEDEEEVDTTTGEPIKKRTNHNELERKRRQVQKHRLLELKQVVPAIRLEKPSANQILSQAKDYIEELTKKSAELEGELEALTGRKSATLPALAGLKSSPSSKAKTKGPTTRGNRAEENAELDAIRKENTALRTRLEELKSQVATEQSPTPSSYRPFTPSQLQVISSPRDHSISPHPRPLSRPPNYAFPQMLAVALSEHQSENGGSPGHESHRPGSTSLSPIPSVQISSPNGDSHHFHKNSRDLPLVQTESTFQLNYRKRKSRADNDFEVAKREFYSRRNSTVDDLRDQQQRISEVGLLTNFAVQARRASLPSAFLDGFVPPHSNDD